MTRIAIDHVQVAAPPECEAQARVFYTGLLNLAELPKQGETAHSGGCWFRTANIELHVGVTDEFIPARKAHVGFRMESRADLDALASRLEAAGHPVRWDTRLPGVRRFFTADPWGNRLEVMTSED